MESSIASTAREPNIPITAADLLTLTSICPACGYPTLGKGLCAYCKPLTQQAS